VPSAIPCATMPPRPDIMPPPPCCGIAGGGAPAHERTGHGCGEEEQAGRPAQAAANSRTARRRQAAGRRRASRRFSRQPASACWRLAADVGGLAAHPGAAWGAAGTAGWAGGPGCAAGAPRGGRRAEGLQQKGGWSVSIAFRGRQRGLEAAARARVRSAHLSGSWSVPSWDFRATRSCQRSEGADTGGGVPLQAMIAGGNLLPAVPPKPQSLGASACAA
jgi:hypothetical protein